MVSLEEGASALSLLLAHFLIAKAAQATVGAWHEAEAWVASLTVSLRQHSISIKSKQSKNKQANEKHTNAFHEGESFQHCVHISGVESDLAASVAGPNLGHES